MKFNIDLPFFPGLYESYLYSSDDAYFAIKDELDYYHWDYCSEWGPGEPEEKQFYEQLTEDDLDFNFTDYSKDIVDAFVDVWKSHAPEIVLSIGEYHMWSPRMYNFDTDHIYADIELRDDWKDVMRGFMTENTDWLRDRIKKDWTSYDGFMSFMSNVLEEWDSYLFEEEDERYIATMLGYMMYRENEEIIRDMSYEARVSGKRVSASGLSDCRTISSWKYRSRPNSTRMSPYPLGNGGFGATPAAPQRKRRRGISLSLYCKENYEEKNYDALRVQQEVGRQDCR